MAITSITFFLVLYIVAAAYFLVPKKFQWVLLLIVSLGIYFVWSPRGIVYILTTAVTVYLATRAFSVITQKSKEYIKNHPELSSDDKKRYKKRKNSRKKIVVAVTILANVGILAYFKYSLFITEQIDMLTGTKLSSGFVSIIMPLGLSFYTFQLIGYLLDVYWEYYDAETNFFKVLLFTSFFPQITQGPISSFDKLSVQLFEGHTFSYDRFAEGSWRLFWGLLKKMVIADNLAPYMKDIFACYNEYSGITTLLGAVIYTIQIYMDFSGYMDIMCGFCRIIGIDLTENFDTPYFSKSVAEYWRRWHISLGDWFKKYIYFPIAMSSSSRKMAKSLAKKAGKHIGNSVPATLALIVTWFATGLWHGASYAYIVWGLLNGLFIILTVWLEPGYEKAKAICHISNDNKWWIAFQMIRTYIIVMFIKVFPEVGDIRDGFGYWHKMLTGSYELRRLSEIAHVITADNSMNTYYNYAVMAIVLVLLVAVVIVSVMKYRQKDIYSLVHRIPAVSRIFILVICAMIIIVAGIPASNESVFMYAGF